MTLIVKEGVDVTKPMKVFTITGPKIANWSGASLGRGQDGGI